jgi:hypothetical protein
MILLSSQTHQLIRFLQTELSIPTPAIALVMRHYQRDPAPLPMILWQYGLVSIEQLEQVFNWMESWVE